MQKLSTFLILPVLVALLADGLHPAWAQFPLSTAGSRFELADSIEIDLADGAALAQLERAKSFLADQKWDEAVETLRQVMENSEGKLLGVTENRFVGLRDYCQMQLASLPPDALKLYRGRIDPAARKWYEEGMANHDPRFLRKIVDQCFASSWGDDALLALGDMALESGDYATARWYWERIVPHPPPAGQAAAWPGYPDTDLSLASVRARLVLASILEGSTAKASEELQQFTRLHAEARGWLGGREVNYVEALGAMLSESASGATASLSSSEASTVGQDNRGTRLWPRQPQIFDWPTFAGSPARNTISPRKFDAGPVAWRLPLPQVAAPFSDRVASGATAGLSSSVESMADRAATLSYHPAIVGDLVLINTAREILAVRLGTGKPAWGRVDAAIFREQLDQSAADLIPPSNTLGTPRFTSTVFGGKLFAYMGSGITSLPQGQTSAIRPGYLVCLDLAAEGRLLWKIAPEEGWAFDGSPVADNTGVYVAMRRIDIRPRAYVACFDAQSGRLR